MIPLSIYTSRGQLKNGMREGQQRGSVNVPVARNELITCKLISYDVINKRLMSEMVLTCPDLFPPWDDEWIWMELIW